MPRYVETQWRDTAELLKVRAQFYRLGGFEQLDQRRNAVNQVLAWKERDDLPLGLESTALLVEAMLYNEVAVGSQMSMRAVYATAISRFVTGFCDSIQDSARKLSMHEVATRLDMPARFVEMRHESTHKELPSLTRLHQVVEESMQWLWNWYWSKLDRPAAALPDLLAKNEALKKLKDEIHEVLKTYRTGRLMEFKKKSASAKKQSNVAKEACLKCVRLCRGNQEELEVLISVMLDTRIIIPNDKQIGSTMDGAFLLWDNLLRRLAAHQHDFLRLLLICMLERLHIQYRVDVKLDPFREAMSEWVIHILTAKHWAAARKRSSSNLRQLILTECFSHPMHWTLRVAESIITSAELPFRGIWNPILQAAKPNAWSEEQSAPENDTSPESAGPQPVADSSTASSKMEKPSNDAKYADPPQNEDASQAPEADPPSGWHAFQGRWRHRYIGVETTCFKGAVPTLG